MTHTLHTEPAPDGDAAVDPRFSDLGLPERLLSALSEDGYDTPSPIQAAIIPPLLQGQDVIGQAQTGTGKTAAFALPILAQIAASQDAGEPRSKGPWAMVLTPTRELAIQVADAFGKYARKLSRVRVLAVYGGADFRPQATALGRGVDIVVGTPGRVMDHMRRETLDVSTLKTLVLDEADEMLRMGFVEDVEWVLSETPAGRQVALFSATMPGAIKAIAERQLVDPVRIRIEGGGQTADTVRQRYWRVEGLSKIEALCRLLAFEPVDSAIVFVRTREATAVVARQLEDAGYPAAPLSGDIAQAQRERTIDALREGRLKLVVATDVAARGIDVKSITHVFNYDVPEDAEAYIHRIGRTGRAGRTGEAILFVENRQRRLLQNIERETASQIEKMELPTSEQIHALQLERFAEQLKERLSFKGLLPKPAALRGFIEQICVETGRDAADVAAFLVGPAMKATLGSTVNTTPSETQARPSTPARPHAERDTRPTRFSGQPVKYRVAVGSNDGVVAGNLVGAIANEAGIDGKAIGGIRIFKTYSTVELPADMPDQLLARLQHTKVKGKPIQLKPFEPGKWSSDHAPAKPHFGQASPAKTTRAHRKGPPPPEENSPLKSKPKPKSKTKIKTKTKAKTKAKSKQKNPPKAKAHGKRTRP